MSLEEKRLKRKCEGLRAAFEETHARVLRLECFLFELNDLIAKGDPIAKVKLQCWVESKRRT